jgi:hypothetical protein
MLPKLRKPLLRPVNRESRFISAGLSLRGAYGPNRGPSDAPAETSAESEAPKEDAVGVIFET